jgi:hypothetical protein
MFRGVGVNVLGRVNSKCLGVCDVRASQSMTLCEIENVRD